MPTLRRIGVMVGIRTGDIDRVALLVLSKEGPPSVLCLAMDQEQKQIAAVNYMQGLMMELSLDVVYDYSHRIQNDQDFAIAQSGLKAAQFHSMLYMNLEHGNYGTALNHQMLAEHSEILHSELNSTPDHPLLMWYWPSIVRDMGNEFEVDDEIVGAAARKRYCQNFKHMRCFKHMREKVGLAKWRTWRQTPWGA